MKMQYETKGYAEIDRDNPDAPGIGITWNMNGSVATIHQDSCRIKLSKGQLLKLSDAALLIAKDLTPDDQTEILE